MHDGDPHLSIIIPVYNEEAILHAAVVDLRERLADLPWSYEVILAENGSTDRTVAVGDTLAKRYPEVRIFSLGQPNYGAALRRGISEARGRYVVCDEIDLCDTDFYRRALPLLERGDADLVVGSKVMDGADDRRPVLRHLATKVMTGMLRVLVGFRGTDTHGLKAFRRAALVPVAERCVVDRDLFASEFVIRADREGMAVREIPIEVVEKRKPSINLFRRVPGVMRNLARLTLLFRLGV